MMREVLTVFIFVILLLPQGAVAHPPSNMQVSYNATGEDLFVTITHIVPNPGVHYVQKVAIFRNGNLVNSSTYTSQPSPDTFAYRYGLHASGGDRFEVTASCSIGGSVTRTLTVTPVETSRTTAETSPAPSAPAASVPPRTLRDTAQALPAPTQAIAPGAPLAVAVALLVISRRWR
jgi:hypothetical protein